VAPSGLYARLCHAFLVFLSSASFLARSAKLPKGLYILPPVVSYCFIFFIFFMISRTQIISRLAEPIFTIFTLNESFLAVDDRSGLFFRYLKGRCHGNRFYAKMANSPYSSLRHSETIWDIATSMGALTAEMMHVYCVKIL